METITVLAVLLVIVLLVVGWLDVAGALAEPDNSRQGVAKRSRANIAQISSEGREAMGELSDQYLDQLYDQVTRSNQSNNVRK